MPSEVASALLLLTDLPLLRDGWGQKERCWLMNRFHISERLALGRVTSGGYGCSLCCCIGSSRHSPSLEAVEKSGCTACVRLVVAQPITVCSGMARRQETWSKVSKQPFLFFHFVLFFFWWCVAVYAVERARPRQQPVAFCGLTEILLPGTRDSSQRIVLC